jgi:hypothetical protein
MKIGSSTLKANISKDVTMRPVARPRVGDLAMVEVVSVNESYPNLELPDGTLSRLAVGDRVIGVFGSRQALRGFVGQSPETIYEGETVAILNMGGVIGRFIDSTTSLGEPSKARYLGTLFDSQGTINLSRYALPPAATLENPRPVVLVIGTCMNVGKTVTAAKLIEAATHCGYRVGAAKLSGVGAVRDLRQFEKSGAVDVKSFLDCGLPSTVDAPDLAPIVKSVLNALAGDLLIVELGDGVLGHYKVESVINNAEIMASVAAVVVCAGDLMAAYGAKLYLDTLGVAIDAFSGLATENVSGSDYLEERFGIPAVNGLKYPFKLLSALRLDQKRAVPALAGLAASHYTPLAAAKGVGVG